MLSRFRGPIPNAWFCAIYVFRCVPYVSWVLPLYFVTRAMGIFDTYWGLLLPHVAVHICFFSWIMKGFFDGIDPSMEYAAMIDGCSRWGAFLRVALPSAIPGLTALAILCWLYTWNEFLFALILTAQQHADPHRRHGAVRARARHGMASHERDRGDRARTGADRHALRAEIRHPRVSKV